MSHPGGGLRTERREARVRTAHITRLAVWKNYPFAGTDNWRSTRGLLFDPIPRSCSGHSDRCFYALISGRLIAQGLPDHARVAETSSDAQHLKGKEVQTTA
jgi:hypothetical protein